MSIQIKVLGPDDGAVLSRAAPDVFDNGADQCATVAFLADPRAHIAVAIDDGTVVGFVSAFHYVHPDKPVPELWIDEVGVACTHHQRGLGRALMRSMLDVGRRLGCAQAWVLTNRSNVAAMRLYESVGGIETPEQPVMLEFLLEPVAEAETSTAAGEGGAEALRH